MSTVQEEIIELMDRVEPKKWKKYYGDVCVGIFADFISREIPSEYKVSSPNAYIEGFPTEFDLLVVDKNASPIKYTNAYPPEKVKIGIEIKAHGIFGGHKDAALEKSIKAIKDNFDAVKDKYPHIDFLYLTFEERASTKSKNAINYLLETIGLLADYKVFCLRDSRTKKLKDGEWERLASYLRSMCETRFQAQQ